MSSDLESYYHQSSPQRTLDKQIKPFLQRLHESNINSIHQLKMRLQAVPSKNVETQFSKTLPVFIHPMKSLKKLYSQKQDDNKMKGETSFRKKKSFSLSPTPQLVDDSQQRIHMISPLSKVKKHLIDHINLQEMKQALFKQRKTLNRFEHFCEFIKQKDRSQTKKCKQKSFRETKGCVPSEQKFGSIDKNEELAERFRITARRKFWRQSRTTQSGEDPVTSQILSIKGLVKPFD